MAHALLRIVGFGWLRGLYVSGDHGAQRFRARLAPPNRWREKRQPGRVELPSIPGSEERRCAARRVRGADLFDQLVRREQVFDGFVLQLFRFKTNGLSEGAVGRDDGAVYTEDYD